MLKHTFCHLPGIGAKTEEKLWNAGITTWEEFMEADGGVLTAGKKATAMLGMEESLERMKAGDADFFASRLPASEHWRLMPRFGDKVAYIDIESTGLGGPGDHITTIALYDGRQVKTYVHGKNLDDFKRDIAEYSLVVTFNGKCFDIPFIERAFNITMPKAHIDLRYVLNSLGYKGGLKKVEKTFGIGRDDLDGVDGYFAVLLWRDYWKFQDEKALDTLLAYNVADVLGLEILLYHAVSGKLAGTPFREKVVMEKPELADNPFTPDAELVERIKAMYYS